jgi:uncharacterized membrane protein
LGGFPLIGSGTVMFEAKTTMASFAGGGLFSGDTARSSEAGVKAEMVSLATTDLSAKTAGGMEHRARSASSRQQTGVFIIMTVIGVVVVVVVVVLIENVEIMRSDDSQKVHEAKSTRQSPRSKVHEAKSTTQSPRSNAKGSTKKGHCRGLNLS